MKTKQHVNLSAPLIRTGGTRKRAGAIHWRWLVIGLGGLIFAQLLSPAEAQPEATPPPPRMPPYITAGPSLIPISKRQNQGTSVLIWDGGRRHRNAQLWVKVNGGEETLVAEQAQGTRQVTAERGKTYIYILKDAGKPVASVSVEARALPGL